MFLRKEQPFCKHGGTQYMADKVLIVDDDPAIRKLLEKIMIANDLEPFTADSGLGALNLLFQNIYDVILMDVMLGDMEGFEVIKRIRSHAILTPVIIISGRNEDFDTVYGLSVGADDYITKPFRALVVGAKVKAMIRRSKVQKDAAGALLECGPFSYDAATMRFFKNGEELILSSKESSLLLLFLKHSGQIFTKDMIYDQVWGTDAVDDNAIMVYVNRLRSKIEKTPGDPKFITTVRGVGYRFTSVD